MIGAIVGEYFGGSFDALGILIRSDAQIFDFETAWAGILVACSSASRSTSPSRSPSARPPVGAREPRLVSRAGPAESATGTPRSNATVTEEGRA